MAAWLASACLGLERLAAMVTAVTIVAGLLVGTAMGVGLRTKALSRLGMG